MRIKFNKQVTTPTPAPVATPTPVAPPAPVYVPPSWTNGMSSQNWMGKDIYGQNNQWFMDNAGTQQDITGLYDNYQGYQGIDNGLAAGLMIQGNQNNLIQGWDGKFYSDMFPEFRRRDAIGFDGYDFRDAAGQQYIFNKNGNEITDYLGWKPTAQNHIGLAAEIFGPDQMIKGQVSPRDTQDQVYSKYGLIVGGLNQHKDFVKDQGYVPEDGYNSSMYNSISDPDFSVRDYQLYADSDPLGSINAQQFYNASHGAGWHDILSGTDPILIDKTGYGEGYETWGRFAKYVDPMITSKNAYWNYYGGENGEGGPSDSARLGKSYGKYLEQFSPGAFNSDVKNATWLKDDVLGTGFTFSEDQKDDRGFAPNTAHLSAKKTPAWQKVVGPLLTIASFIPGINAVAIPLNAAYNIGMGIKNGNWAQAIGGVIGMPGLGQVVGGVAGSTIGGTMAGGLSQVAGLSPALSQAIISGGLGAISNGWEGALGAGLGSYAGSYLGSTVGDLTHNYDLGMTVGGLTNSMINQLINTGKLNPEALAAQGLAGGLNALIKSV